jgi:hypothetical protein
MSIFSKQDSHLPLLTQVYQLDESDNEEVVAFYSLNGEEYAARWLRQIPTDAPEEWNRLQTHFRATRQAMNDLYCMRSLHLGTAQMIEHWVNNETPKYSLIVSTPPEELATLPPLSPYPKDYLTSGGLIPIEQITFKRDTFIKHQIQQELLAVIKRYEQGGKPLSKCVTCGSVFLTNRSGQRFCSHRCSHTEGTRRRRKK